MSTIEDEMKSELEFEPLPDAVSTGLSKLYLPSGECLGVLQSVDLPQVNSILMLSNNDSERKPYLVTGVVHECSYRTLEEHDAAYKKAIDEKVRMPFLTGSTCVYIVPINGSISITHGNSTTHWHFHGNGPVTANTEE